MRKLENTAGEEGGRRIEQLFVAGSLCFHSLVFLTNVATSLCSDLPAQSVCQRRREGGTEGGRCMSCTFAQASPEIATAQLTVAGAQQNI